MQSCQRVVAPWRCRCGQRRFGASNSIPAISLSSSPIMDRLRGKTRWSPYRSRSEGCDTGSVQIAQSLCSHVDQPSNDFNALFEVLDVDPDRYVLDEPNVFPAAIGRSFYESVLPPGSVHLGWCSYAAVWLSRIPALIPGHFISFRGTDAVRAEFERQAAQDWEAFLSLRARELRAGSLLDRRAPGPY